MGRPALCVLCRTREIEPRWRPFCSRRCQALDQARWADGAYHIDSPSTTVPDSHAGDDDEDNA